MTDIELWQLQNVPRTVHMVILLHPLDLLQIVRDFILDLVFHQDLLGSVLFKPVATAAGVCILLCCNFVVPPVEILRLQFIIGFIIEYC